MVATELADVFVRICGPRYVSTDASDNYLYGQDQTMDLHFPFDVLVKPANPEEVSMVLEACSRYGIAVTPRGGGSGVTGGALPVQRGVVLSTERLNSILGINEIDRYVVAECGVVTADLCRALEERGLYFPVAPGSAAYSFIGGNVAENSGSPASCKYGTTGSYVLNLEVVLPTGEIMWTGSNVKKDVSGLDLTSLFVGSEGILGVITKVVYRVLPKPRYERMLLAGFRSLGQAIDAVLDIGASGLRPCAVELICGNALRFTAAWLGGKLPLLDAFVDTHLLVGFEETDALVLEQAVEQAGALLSRYTEEDILVASDAQEKASLMRLRSNIGNAMVARNSMYRDIDCTVPLGLLCEYIERVGSICDGHGLGWVCFGHAMDGNLHTMIVADRQSANKHVLEVAAGEIYTWVTAAGGALSGEHGIGILQKGFMGLQFSPVQLDLMRRIRSVFDPAGILNPGKKI